MSISPLQRALAWFGERDEMGGFRTAGKVLFAGWEPKRCCRAPHREDREASFSVYRNEREEWRFKDFGTDEHGGLVGFAMLAGMDEKQASRWLMEQAGVVPCGAGRAVSRREGRRSVTPKSPAIPARRTSAEPVKLSGMPPEALAAWTEGTEYLAESAERVQALADFRGWPLEWAQFAADRRAISMPLYHGERTIAFLVEAPVGRRGGMEMRTIGFHCRLQPRGEEKRASWRFVPNLAEHGQSTPALPFILGGAGFDSAKLLVITGGQWDAITFDFAAGWLGHGCSAPPGVCIIGLRGDASSNVFLRHYAPFWPPAANCLLLPDNDASGARWLEGADSFARRLSVRCPKVSVGKCGGHKDFNDLYRASGISPGQIADLLARHGMSIPEEAKK